MWFHSVSLNWNVPLVGDHQRESLGRQVPRMTDFRVLENSLRQYGSFDDTNPADPTEEPETRVLAQVAIKSRTSMREIGYNACALHSRVLAVLRKHQPKPHKTAEAQHLRTTRHERDFQNYNRYVIQHEDDHLFYTIILRSDDFHQQRAV